MEHHAACGTQSDKQELFRPCLSDFEFAFVTVQIELALSKARSQGEIMGGFLFN